MKNKELNKKVLQNHFATLFFSKSRLLMLNCVCILSFTLCIQVSAGSYSKSEKITMGIKDMKLKDVFPILEEKGKIRLIYSEENQAMDNVVSVEVKDTKVLDVLKIILNGTGLQYRIFNDDLIAIVDPTAQAGLDINLKGVVRDVNGEAIAGVNVKIKGETGGTTTDQDGAFNLTVPDDAVLVFSYIGFVPQEIPIDGQSTIEVVLEGTSEALSEVVVTALGIKRESRRLGYSATSVDTEQLTTNRMPNVGNSLQGKVAGLNVSPPAAGPGSSSKIRIRGQSSFGGNNSPLIVVNGIPINNSSISAGGSSGSGTGNPTGGSSDSGDGLQSINPDDIESMTILKGAAAAALYGSRAKDGAILITTKRGAEVKGIGIEFNSSTQAEQALDYTDFQYVYGQGEFGIRPATVGDAQSSGVFSFGERMDGQPTPQFDGSTQPYQAYRNRIRDFYRIGINATNSLALLGGNDKGSFRMSFANTDASSIMPNSKYQRNILNLGVNYNLTEKLSTLVNVNYSNEYNKNPPQIGIQDMSANSTIYTLATSIDTEWLKQRQDANGDEMPLSRFTNRNNPYWVAYDRFENVRRDRIFGNVSARYQFTDWMYLQARFGQDYFTRPYDYNRPTGTRSIAPAPVGFNGYYYQDVTTFRETNADFFLGINRTFSDFGIDVTLGGNQMRQVTTNNSVENTNFFVRDVYTVMNSQIKNPQYSYLQTRINSLFGSADFSYKNFLFLTLTARNDWFSTLNPNSNNYLYPSISTSFVFSDAFTGLPDWINYGKLRAAYAEVGGGTDPYTNNLYYSINANQFNGAALGTPSNLVAPNANLRPLKIREAEIGMEARFANSRINIDVAAYRKNTVDEILNVDISNTSGYSQTRVNIGQLRNEGVEMLLTLIPLAKENVRWESAFNVTYNRSEVLQLADGQQRVDVGQGEFFGTVSHEIGMPLASLRGFDYRRDDQGRILVSGGMPLQGDLVTFGSAIPKWTGGWVNTFNYKKLRISAQLDFKADYQIMSNSNMNFLRHGLSQASLEGREDGVVFPGVNTDGTPNTTAVEAQTFYTVYRNTNIATPFMFSGNFLRVRFFSVGYDLSEYFKRTFSGVSITASVNNPFIISKAIDNLDPEAQVSTSDNLQGIETHTLPTARTFGLNFNIKL